MQCVLLEIPTGDMPLNETDRAWIRETVRDSHKRQGFGKFTGFVKDWSGTGAAVAILILAITQWGGYVEFRTRTGDRLDRIENDSMPSLSRRIDKLQTSLNVIISNAAPQLQKAINAGISSAISTTSEQSKGDLADAANALAQLNVAGVSLPQKETDRTSQQLLHLADVRKDVPETWVLIGRFITYRSQMISGWKETNLPLCDDQFHRFHGTVSGVVLTHGPVEINNCKIVLDSPTTTQNLSVDLSMASVVFTHCVVFYNGGPVIVIPVKIATDNHPPKLIGNITFKDCAFIVSLSGAPTENGVHLAKSLLQDPSNLQVTITAPG